MSSVANIKSISYLKSHAAQIARNRLAPCRKWLVYRRINGDVYVYTVAGHRQDYPTLWMKRLLKIDRRTDCLLDLACPNNASQSFGGCARVCDMRGRVWSIILALQDAGWHRTPCTASRPLGLPVETPATLQPLAPIAVKHNFCSLSPHIHSGIL
jgi:hypothetical protein